MVYVGQTVKDLDKYVKRNYEILLGKGRSKLNRAIKKYKWESFIYGEVCKADSKKELDELETYMIAYFNAVEDGYNLRSGGAHGKHSKESCDQLSKTLKGRRLNPINNFSIENGEPILRKTPGKWKHKKYEEDDIIQEKLGEDVPLVQVLSDTAHWLNWNKAFGPLSGHSGKVKNELHRSVATVFAYGTGLGPREGASVLNGYTERQLSRTNEKNITAEKLDKAIAIIANAYMKLQLPLQWGDGTRLAGDGSLWVLSRHSPFGERHIRYGRWGGIAYYHVADNYIAIFSKFIPCGVYEAVHILDPLIKKLVEIKGKIIHGDTHAQSASVYGLAFLLGIKLMPRIRNWKDLKFYKSNMETKFQNIEKLFNSSWVSKNNCFRVIEFESLFKSHPPKKGGVA